MPTELLCSIKNVLAYFLSVKLVAISNFTNFMWCESESNCIYALYHAFPVGIASFMKFNSSPDNYE